MTDPRDTSASSCPQTSGQQLAEPTAPGFPGLAPNCQASWSALLAGPKGTCSVLGLLWEPSSSSVSSSPLPLLGGPHLPCSSGAAPVPLRQEQPAPGHAPARPPARCLHCGPDLPSLLASSKHGPPATRQQQDSSASWLEPPVFRAHGAPAAACLLSPQPGPHWTLLEAKPALAFPLGVPSARSTWGPTAAPAAPAPQQGSAFVSPGPGGGGGPAGGCTWLTHSSAHQGADLGDRAPQVPESQGVEAGGVLGQAPGECQGAHEGSACQDWRRGHGTGEKWDRRGGVKGLPSL